MSSNRKIKEAKVCRFTWTNRTGQFDASRGKYDGAIGALSEGSVDLFIRPIELGMIGLNFVNFIEVPLAAERISPVQMVEREVDQATIDLSLSSSFRFWVPSTDLLLLMVIGCLIHFVISFLFQCSIKRTQAPPGSNLKLKILSFFYLLFIFFTEEFFGNSLSSEQVIVRTDGLLYSRDNILNTNKEFCFFENSVEFEFMIKVSLSYSLAYLKPGRID